MQNDYTEYDGKDNFHQEEQLKKFSWGAFAMSPLWGLCNGVYWPLLLIPLSMIPFVGSVLDLIGAVYFGIKGNRMAWNSKHEWDGFDHFLRVQRGWNIAGIIVFGLSLLVGIIIGLSEILIMMDR